MTSTPSNGSPHPGPAPTSAEERSEAHAGVEISKVHGRDAFVVYDAKGDELGSIKKKSGEEWRVALEGHPKPAITFTSAVAARAFVFGFFHGKPSK